MNGETKDDKENGVKFLENDQYDTFIYLKCAIYLID